jgi:transcription antitermination factor NusA-like protein
VVPEVLNGVVEVKSIAREAGYRSKIAVAATGEGIDPVGCCVGLRGIRIQNIMRELSGEKLDVVLWSSSPQTFISNALSPAQVLSVTLDENEGIATVVVPDKQLSLAIGKEGQNARLAAKLTGWRIDIKSASTAEVEQLAKAEASPEEEVEAELPGMEEPALAPAEVSAEPEAPLETELVPPEALRKSQDKAEPSQLRFAEDVLKFAPTKAVAKSRKKKKETREKRVDDGAKARKRRQKPELPDEEEEY